MSSIDGPDEDGFDPVGSDGKVVCPVRGRDVIERYLAELAAKDAKFRVPDGKQIGYEYNDRGDAEDARPYWRTYFLDRAVILSGAPR